MHLLAGIFAFGLPFALPSLFSPVGFLVWTVIAVVGICILLALLHILYVLACGLVFIHLWIKGIIEARGKRENR